MAGFAIRRPATAFSNAPAAGKKRPREKDKDHLEFIRTLPCVVSGVRPVEAAHIRMADPSYGKRETGTAERPDDRWVVPLSPAMHREQHSGSEAEFWTRHGIDPCKVALALYAVTGDDQQADIILRNARTRSILDRPTNNPEIIEGDHE